MYWITVGPFKQTEQAENVYIYEKGIQIVFSEAILENRDSEKDFQDHIEK